MNGEKLIAMLDGEPFELQKKMLRDYADHVLIDEVFLRDLIFDLADAELMKHIIENYCEGFSVSEDFLQLICDEYDDGDLLVETLETLYSGRQVSERFLDSIVEQGDEYLLRYVLDNHFIGKKVSIDFIHEVVNEFQSTALTAYVIRNYY